jgi:hypothetical protein
MVIGDARESELRRYPRSQRLGTGGRSGDDHVLFDLNERYKGLAGISGT